ncbi:MAG: homoserine dehydrogenase [Paracoccaceae bacterium]|nr:homoserine dehydrogenase [Paracoccaceae bacterium]MDE2912940.1 homoserine dehydrogenase [Paracoccaceae bacterium]
MEVPIRIGLAGLGTVGTGLVKILTGSPGRLAGRCGRPVCLVAVSARSRLKDRGIDVGGFAWEDDPVALARRDDIDIFVELIGGEDGPARASIHAALAAGHHVVTANKALLARHGQSLAELAESRGVSLCFEAAVAGGIPIIKVLKESLAGNRITRIAGVMNGTCNYILTRMESAGLSYDDVFREAAALGYLEADPTLDVGGIDAAQKLSLLSSIAFGTRVSLDSVTLDGIERVSIADIEHATELGYRIKLLGVAAPSVNGLQQSMRPCLVPKDSPLGQLEGATNMVVVTGDPVGQIVLRGAGAGEGPTASAVVGDILDIARGVTGPVFGKPADQLTEPRTSAESGAAPFYLRLTLVDQPGVLARVASALADVGVSIDRMRQKSHHDDAAPVLIVTHPATQAAIDSAVSSIAETGVCTDPPVALRIETA